MKNEENWKKRYYAQKKELKRLNKALEKWNRVVELSVHNNTKLVRERQELYNEFCQLQNQIADHRCFWSLFKKE